MTLDELKTHKKSIKLELEKIEREYKKSNTNHILHLILSLVSMGFWLIVWAIIAQKNHNKRGNLEKTMDESKVALEDINDSIMQIYATQK